MEDGGKFLFGNIIKRMGRLFGLEIVHKHNYDEQLLKKYDNKIKNIFLNLIKKEDVGQELEIFAESEEDSTIEGYFHKRYPIIGVMWHPERDQEQEYQSKIINILYNQLIWKS